MWTRLLATAIILSASGCAVLRRPPRLDELAEASVANDAVDAGGPNNPATEIAAQDGLGRQAETTLLPPSASSGAERHARDHASVALAIADSRSPETLLEMQPIQSWLDPDAGGVEPAGVTFDELPLEDVWDDSSGIVIGPTLTPARLPPVQFPALDLARLLPRKRQRSPLPDMLVDQAERIRTDHIEFYSLESLTWLVAGVGLGATMANTGFDEHFLRDTYRDNVVVAASEEYYQALHQPKFLGEGWYTIPVFAGAALLDPLVGDTVAGGLTAEWGQRSLRTILVGGPPLLALQMLTGASRPGETTAGSHWKPLDDNNGASGHSFMGAIPFLSAAKMTDSLWLKSGLYALSTMAGLSRVNDDHHYFSQVFLGWWMAYLAASAVDRSQVTHGDYQIFAYPTADGVGIGVEFLR